MMRIGNRAFDVNHNCYIMGILNVTPDSFSDGGKWNDLERARAHVEKMIEEGAAIIDIGGESTRPGHRPVSAQEEIHRVVPFIKMVKASFDIPVSVDTYKSQVAEAALDAGADLVNDIWGLKYDPAMADLIAARGVACCLMHNRKKAEYEDFMMEMLDDLRESLTIAARAGISRDKIILDPGVGFGKTFEHNLTVINHLEEVAALGYPVLLATSRKSVIGTALDLPTDQRIEGTLVTTVMGVEKGAAFVRVHDVRENDRAIRMTMAVKKQGNVII